MAQNKNFVERDVKDGDEPLFETLKFNDLKNADGGQGDWLSHIMLGYIPAPEFNQMCEAPGWNPDQMQVSINVNGLRVIHASFEAMISEFSGRMLTQRIQKGKWDKFETAVEEKAKRLLKQSMGDFIDNAYKLSENLSHLAASSDTLIQSVWNIPYKYTVTTEMKDAGAKAIEDFGVYTDTETNRRIVADKIYNAMVTARPPEFPKTVKLKLPPAMPPMPGDFLGSVDKRVVAIRKEVLAEVKALLEQHNIDVDDL